MIRRPLSLAIAVVLATSYGASPRAASVGPGVGNIPQGTQTDDSFRNSFAANHVTNVFATTQQVSCYTPEVPFAVSDGPVDWYSGETPCNGAATTGEALGIRHSGRPDQPEALDWLDQMVCQRGGL